VVSDDTRIDTAKTERAGARKHLMIRAPSTYENPQHPGAGHAGRVAAAVNRGFIDLSPLYLHIRPFVLRIVISIMANQAILTPLISPMEFLV